jgi:phosphoglucomutase
VSGKASSELSIETRGNPIRFGTSGWRALIAEDFTFANVRLAVAAIADHVRSRKTSPTLIIGHDTRFLAEEFAGEAAQVLRARGVQVLLCQGPAPTPAIAYEILRRHADGAINFTASHNPAEYQGLKFSAADGGPALPEVTRDIEARAAALSAPALTPHDDSRNGFERIDVREPYLARLRELVRLAALREAKLKIVCDPVHGCGAGYLDRILAGEGVEVAVIRAERDVLFDGHGPDPSEENLRPLAKAVREGGAHVGLATDGDADRFGIVDSDGSFLSPNHLLALVYDYLIETRGWRLGVARSVATTHLVDAVAQHHHLPLYQTPVGFKYIGEYIKQDKIAAGGEESAGMTIRGHVPEKDGILACLLAAEMIAARRAPLREQLRELFRKVGREYWPVRENLHLRDEVQARVVSELQKDWREFAGHRVARVDRTDGLKMIFDNESWVLLRLSGTEPVMRVYAEAATPEASQRLISGTREWIES